MNVRISERFKQLLRESHKNSSTSNQTSTSFSKQDNGKTPLVLPKQLYAYAVPVTCNWIVKDSCLINCPKFQQFNGNKHRCDLNEISKSTYWIADVNKFHWIDVPNYRCRNYQKNVRNILFHQKDFHFGKNDCFHSDIPFARVGYNYFVTFTFIESWYNAGIDNDWEICQIKKFFIKSHLLEYKRRIGNTNWNFNDIRDLITESLPSDYILSLINYDIFINHFYPLYNRITEKLFEIPIQKISIDSTFDLNSNIYQKYCWAEATSIPKDCKQYLSNDESSSDDYVCGSVGANSSSDTDSNVTTQYFDSTDDSDDNNNDNDNTNIEVDNETNVKKNIENDKNRSSIVRVNDNEYCESAVTNKIVKWDTVTITAMTDMEFIIHIGCAESESHATWVPIFAYCIDRSVNCLCELNKEIPNPIITTTDGGRANIALAEKIEETLINDHGWCLDHLNIIEFKHAFDTWHRIAILYKPYYNINTKDWEFWIAFKDRAFVINKFDCKPCVHNCDGKSDIATLLIEHKNIFDDQYCMSVLLKFVKRSMILYLTRKPENIDYYVNDKYNLNDTELLWAETVIRKLMYKCVEYHLPMLFGVLFDKSTYEEATQTKTMDIKIIKNNNEKIIKSPTWQAPISIIKHFIRNLNLRTHYDIVEILTNLEYCNKMFGKSLTRQDIAKLKYIDIDLLKECGYQSSLQATYAMDSVFDLYTDEVYQCKNEKKNGKALFDNPKVQHLRKNETCAEMIQCYINNQYAAYDRVKGSMINELFHSYCNGVHWRKGSKSAATAMMLCIYCFLRWNIHRMNVIVKSNYNKDNLLSQCDYNDFNLLINDATTIKYIYDKYEQDGYLHINIDSKKQVIQLAQEWCRKQNLKPKKPWWNDDRYNELKIWASENNNEVNIKDKENIESFFKNIYSWEFIVKKASNINLPISR